MDEDEERESGAPVFEGRLSILALTEREEKSLGIQVAPAEMRSVPREIELTGWVEPRPGASVEIRAPVAGHLLPRDSWPVPGKPVERGEILGALLPVMGPADQLQVEAVLLEIDAKSADLDRDITRSRASLDLAGARLDRAKKLLAGTAGTEKSLQEAVFLHAEARAELEAAEKKKAALELRRRAVERRLKTSMGTEGKDSPDEAAPSPLPLSSPLAGKLMDSRGAPGKFVEAGEAIFRVSSTDTVWVRVPVFEGDLVRIQREAPLRILLPGEAKNSGTIQALPAAQSMAVDPRRRAADLYYQVSNPKQLLLEGQSLVVRISTGEVGEALYVASSAILFDPEGGSWAYVSLGERRYARRRVETGAWFNDRVEVRRGLSAGEPVVVAGAAELFGAELGTGGGEEDEAEE